MTSAVLHTVPVALAERSYAIHIGHGVATDASTWQAVLGDDPSPLALIVSSEPIAALHLAEVAAALRAQGLRVGTCVRPDGEAQKDWAGLRAVIDALFAHGADRHALLIALGGGVIGDLTGFAAAIYMRGIRFVQVPTTLLAQVDSSVGGKTAINHPLGKNMIGAFHQPSAVLADLRLLATLPQREYRSGLAEVIKYAAIADADFMPRLQADLPALLARDPQALAHTVARSCALKAAIVGQDERETGEARAWLNFGHTVAHAIEAQAGYGQWLHGEAVAAGMVVSAWLSEQRGQLPGGRRAELGNWLTRAGLPLDLSGLSAAALIGAMRMDKKNRAGTLRDVLIDGDWGRAMTCDIPDPEMAAALHAHGAH